MYIMLCTHIFSFRCQISSMKFQDTYLKSIEFDIVFCIVFFLYTVSHISKLKGGWNFKQQFEKSCHTSSSVRNDNCQNYLYN